MIGIVAEYNPFHDGHKYHIDNYKDECIVAVMSGDFVQRGEPAIFDKFSRARQAVKNGVNLVVELPLPWSISSAETFAFGGVKILESIGVDKISFGSECGDINQLYNIASYDCNDVIKYMKEHPNVNFPTARKIVVGSPLLDYPNNSLGIEYIKAASVPCVTVKRSTLHDGNESAKSIREQMQFLGLGYNYRKFEIAAISRLRMFSKDYFNSLPDSENGVGNRLYKSVQNGNTLSEIYNLTKTKSLTMSAVRRLTMCAILGVTKDMNEGAPPYIRILAFDSLGREAIKKDSLIPFITQPKEIYDLGEFAQKVFAVGASSHDFYELGNDANNHYKCGFDYRNGPIIV